MRYTNNSACNGSPPPPPIERRSHLSWEIRARVGRPRGNGDRCEIVGFSRGARTLFVAIVCRTARVRSPCVGVRRIDNLFTISRRAHARARAYAGAQPSCTRCPETVWAEKIFAFHEYYIYEFLRTELVNSMYKKQKKLTELWTDCVFWHGRQVRISFKGEGRGGH